MDTEFKIGDRVVVKPDRADGYLQPWRNRFRAGRAGTIVRVSTGWGFVVQWDYKKCRYPSDFQLTIHPGDLAPEPPK